MALSPMHLAQTVEITGPVVPVDGDSPYGGGGNGGQTVPTGGGGGGGEKAKSTQHQQQQPPKSLRYFGKKLSR